MPGLRFTRRKKLIRPKLQLWLVGSFVGLAGLALLLQFLVLSFRLTSELSKLDGASGQLAGEVPGMMLQVLVVSMAVLLPIIFVLGVLMTFRIAGPIYRFESFLASVARGEQIGPCKIRKGDKLQNLCELINEATEPVRRRAMQDEPASERSTG